MSDSWWPYGSVTQQAPLSIGFFRQEYWSGLPFAPPENLPKPGTEPASLKSPALASSFFTTSTTWEAYVSMISWDNFLFLSTCSAGDPCSIPGSGRSAAEGIGYPLQYSWASLLAQLVKKSACNVGDLGLIPGLGRSSGEGKGYPVQYSGLENSMDCIVHGAQRVRHDWATFTLLSHRAYVEECLCSYKTHPELFKSDVCNFLSSCLEKRKKKCKKERYIYAYLNMHRERYVPSLHGK